MTFASRIQRFMRLRRSRPKVALIGVERIMQNEVAHRVIAMTNPLDWGNDRTNHARLVRRAVKNGIKPRAVDYSTSAFATARNTVSAAPNVAASTFVEYVA